jgi:hypothetical protein
MSDCSYGWKYDLPGPNDPLAHRPCSNFLINPPNRVNTIFLDLPRATFRSRGVLVIIAIFFMPVFLFSTCNAYSMLFSRHGSIDMMSVVVALTTIIAPLWGGIFFYRLDLETPLDEPIRFNRERRKIYVYRFHFSGLKPFSRTAWGVRPAVYDWDDVRAEFCSVYGPMGSGGLSEAVFLRIMEPGTGKVLDRFILAHGGIEAEMYWAMAQLFMQQGKQALPKFHRPPRDWNNEQHTFNLARRFAPKVVWPEAMDIESRTAP